MTDDMGRHGYSEQRLDQIIAAEEEKRRGFSDHPWKPKFKKHVMGLIVGLGSEAEIVEKIQEEARLERGGDGRA